MYDLKKIVLESSKIVSNMYHFHVINNQTTKKATYTPGNDINFD